MITTLYFYFLHLVRFEITCWRFAHKKKKKKKPALLVCNERQCWLFSSFFYITHQQWGSGPKLGGSIGPIILHLGEITHNCKETSSEMQQWLTYLIVISNIFILNYDDNWASVIPISHHNKSLFSFKYWHCNEKYFDTVSYMLSNNLNGHCPNIYK